jgi:hypothetical protein
LDIFSNFLIKSGYVISGMGAVERNKSQRKRLDVLL